jgi:hypothetical protein
MSPTNTKKATGMKPKITGWTTPKEDRPMNSTADDSQQQADEERAFFRCVELAQVAQRGERFTPTDLDDLIYHLGVREFFKEKT